MTKSVPAAAICKWAFLVKIAISLQNIVCFYTISANWLYKVPWWKLSINDERDMKYEPYLPDLTNIVMYL